MKRSITIDILNETVIQLLRDLEKLKFIHVRNENAANEKPADSIDFIKKYMGKMTKQTPESIDEQFQQLRKEWD